MRNALTMIALLGGLSSAAAQAGAETAAARSLFQQGLGFADQEQWEQAADRFERALELRWAAPIAFNLADAQNHLGRFVDASEHLRSIARREGSADVKAAAAALLQEVEPRLAHLHVALEGATDDIEIRLDDRPLRAAMLGVPIPVDPGVHQVIAYRDDQAVARQSVEVTEGQRADASLDIPAVESSTPDIVVPDPAEVAAEVPLPPPPPPPPPPSRIGLVVGLTVAAIVVVAAAVVVAILLAGGSASKLEGNFQPGRLEGEAR